MTPEARAESIMICSCPPASKEPKIHIFSCLGSQRKSVADQIRQAEAAARRKALEEVMEILKSGKGPDRIFSHIYALMDNLNVS